MPARIAIVEDEAIVALDLRRQVEDLGHEVMGVFASADVALAACAGAPPDLALMDVRLLTSTDGITAAEELYVCSDVAVVLVSAHTDAETIARASRAGVYAFIAKPFSIDSTRAAISLALAKHTELRRAARAADRYRTAVEHAATAIVTTDEARRIVLLNPAAARLLETSAAAAVDRDLGSLVAGLDPWASVVALATLAPAAPRTGAGYRGATALAVTVARAPEATTARYVWTIAEAPPRG